MNEKMSSVRNLLSQTKSKKEYRNAVKKEQSRITHATFAQKNRESIDELIKERCPLDHAKIMEIVDGFLGQARECSPTKLELPPLSPGVLSNLLYNMALWIGNTNQVDQ